MDTRSISFYTFGCKVNQYETEKLKSLAQKEGWRIKSLEEETDYIFIHSCAVTHIAERKARRLIKFLRKKFPNSKIILAGCYPERLKNYNLSIDVDILLDNKEKWEFFKGEETSFILSVPQERTRALVKIQDGCRQFCNYCIVPYLRGRERSKPQELVIQEIENLIKLGYKEIVLTGIRLGAYGHDFQDKDALSKLLKRIIKYPEIKRIRLSSIEPLDITPSLIELAGEEKICRHWHIPLQSGDDEILRKMNRRYDTSYYYDIIQELRKRVRDIAITTDVIVGYPEEKDVNFENTVNFIKKVGFMKLHVFPFSSRPGTFAEKLSPLPPSVIEERKRILINLSKDLWKKYAEKFLGKEMEVLVEEVQNGVVDGLTDNYLKVVFNDNSVNKGDFVKVFLKEICEEKILGEKVKNMIYVNS
ncbi:MAG: tRNA (N(6)-L-threonylcarbamoyladenosine(37)-C(2))-methylthiotransferase MtaB [Dictyoglomus sp.]|nr:tRNA (N(6)-L-threonylcarbamoyladenosine(37)-C(2))-methylthiotransferase MtaB [Dictyoglomus sp.]MDW8188168.1 tRNA (N(6)-L-threonylcarbamoyladenosine(37)-C(2))-methylthiotransferase MtaB [Dictyoglomus sp.]